jgi:hypothetical protein
MADLHDSDAARQQFAVDRSQTDAESSNTTARSTAQAAILINGGAATAILAFLSKENLNPSIVMTASVCLGLYALGVLLGAFMMFCIVRSLDFYSLRWRLEAHPMPGADAESSQKLAQSWWWRMRRCFYFSMLSFVISSFALGGALFHWGLVRYP